MRTKLLLLILCTFMPIFVSAYSYDVKIDGIYYIINTKTLTAKVARGEDQAYKGSVNIPDSITYGGKTLPVTEIEDYAFSRCDELTSLKFPKNFKRLSDYMCFRCNNLSEVTLPDSLTFINECSFSGCSSLKSILIPQTVTIIDEGAFSGCTSLPTTLTIPSHIKEIGSEAWESCNIKKLIIEDSDEKLKNYGTYSGWGNTFSGIHPDSVYVGRNTTIFNSNDSVRYVEFGPKLTDWGRCNFVGDSTKIIVSDIPDPSQISAPSFTNYVYVHTTLYVPKGTLDLYKNAEGWSQFFNIKENDGTSTGLNSINKRTASHEIKGIYNLSGQEVSESTKGIVIIKYNDGTSQKVYR